jgi:hypothetical protein
MRFYFEPPAPKKKPNTIRRLLVRCPKTAKLAPTGETIDEKLWADVTKRTGRFTCPHCKEVHTWAKKDVLQAR